MADRNFPKKDSKGNEITPHITKVIVETEEVKDSAFKKAAKVFFSEDIDRVTNSIVDDFVKPRTKSFGLDLIKKLKEFMYSSITDFAGSIFFGRGSSGSSSYSKNGANYTSYSKYGGKSAYYNEYADDYYWYNGSYYKNDRPADTIQHDIIRERPIRDSGKAQEVLDELKYIARTTKEQCVAVGDYYTAVGAPVDSLDYEFVWTGPMLEKCRPRYTRRGYILDLPRPVPRK